MKSFLNNTRKRLKAYLVYTYKFIKALVSRINKHGIYPKGAELSYYLVVSALSAFVAIVYIAHYFRGFVKQVGKGAFDIFPSEIAEWANSVINSVSVPGSIPILVGTTVTIIWFVSRAMHSLMRSFNVIYHTTDRGSLIKARAFSILFTLAMVVVFIAIFFLSVLQQSIGWFLSTNFGYSGFFTSAGFSILISIISMLLVFTLLYYQLPNCKTGFAGSFPGALFTTAVWFGLSKVFSYYVNNVTAFSWILGSFGSIFIFLVWLYWLSIIVLTGAELNHMIIERIANRKERL
jgi:membrane protein